MPATFPLARYRFEWRATRSMRLPDYAGSMLRGAFGHALRKLACMTKQKECDGCSLIASCPYPAVFAPVPPVVAVALITLVIDSMTLADDEFSSDRAAPDAPPPRMA